MKLRFSRLVLIGVVFLLSAMIAATVIASGDDDDDHAARNLGAVVLVSDGACQPGKFFDGDRCIELEVVCPMIDDAPAGLRVTGTGTIGTVVLTTGGNGTGLYGNQAGDVVEGFINDLLGDGYLVVELAWDDLAPGPDPLLGVWEKPAGSTLGSISLACRSATALEWIFENLHQGGLFIAQGNSGGSAQIAFSLAYYGLNILDLANLSGGPPPCPISAGGVVNFADQEDCVVDGLLFDENHEPLLFEDPRLDYPNTSVRFFIGEDEPSEYITQTANEYHDRIESDKCIQIISNTEHQVGRTAEGAAAMLASIRAIADEGSTDDDECDAHQDDNDESDDSEDSEESSSDDNDSSDDDR